MVKNCGGYAILSTPMFGWNLFTNNNIVKLENWADNTGLIGWALLAIISIGLCYITLQSLAIVFRLRMIGIAKGYGYSNNYEADNIGRALNYRNAMMLNTDNNGKADLLRSTPNIGGIYSNAPQVNVAIDFLNAKLGTMTNKDSVDYLTRK